MSASTSTAAADRRQLRLPSIDALLSEIDRIVAAEKAGTLRQVGHWTPGQAFGHLASWINYGYEGYPMRVPWFIRMFLKRKVRKMLRDGMPAGVRIPGTTDGTYGTDQLPTNEGAAQLRTALARLRNEPAKFDSPAFGKMSHEDRITLTLRHAELHLSFLRYPGD